MRTPVWCGRNSTAYRCPAMIWSKPSRKPVQYREQPQTRAPADNDTRRAARSGAGGCTGASPHQANAQPDSEVAMMHGGYMAYAHNTFEG